MEPILTNIPNIETARWAYRFILGRDAENEAALGHWAIPADGRIILAHFIGSSEATAHRLAGYPVTGSWSKGWLASDAVRAMFHLRFNAIPSTAEIEAEIQAHPDLASFRAAFLASPEVSAIVAQIGPPPPAAPAKDLAALKRPHRFTALGKTFQLSGAAEDAYWQKLVQGPPDRCFAPDRLARLVRAAFPDGGAGRVLVDVGANIGLTAMAMATAAPYFSELLCFEPDARSLPLLQANLASNDLGRARALDRALAGRDGMGQLWGDPNNRGISALVEPYSRVRAVGAIVSEVPVARLDSVLAEMDIGRLDVLKISAGGAETPVISGAAEAIARDQPLIFVEFNPWTLMTAGARNPLEVLEEWHAAFPHMVRFDTLGHPIPVLGRDGLLEVLHGAMTERDGKDNLILCDRLDWLERWGE